VASRVGLRLGHPAGLGPRRGHAMSRHLILLPVTRSVLLGRLVSPPLKGGLPTKHDARAPSLLGSLSVLGN
jgi:hypothetical protein